jgi:single-stranded-DNA-specific exonuclease
MGKPDVAVRLLLHGDPRERERLADEVLLMNEDRKKLGAEVWSVAEPLAQASLDSFGGKLVMAYGNEIHRGITGLMAGRLVGRFKVPALVVAFVGEETATGSLRSAARLRPPRSPGAVRGPLHRLGRARLRRGLQHEEVQLGRLP